MLRGGRRKGAGSKPHPSRGHAITLYLPDEIIAFLKTQEDRSKLVAELIQKYMDSLKGM